MPRNQSKKSGTISPEKVALYDRCHQLMKLLEYMIWDMITLKLMRQMVQRI
jgi:hypothetical protein